MSLEKYTLYYDCGTTNTRAYLFDKNLRVIAKANAKVGARNTAILGENATLLTCLNFLLIDIIDEANISREQIEEIYASGMITSPYGIIEIPHVTLPISIHDFAMSLHSFYENSIFQQNIKLIPGMKTYHKNPAFINNVRGEDIEVLGAIKHIDSNLLQKGIGLLFPGSHTHVLYVKKDQVAGIISNFTGELYEALKLETILSPILSETYNYLDLNMVKKGVENLELFGFNRAIYIAHAMKILKLSDPHQVFSYAEGVINGGLLKSIDYYCEHLWTGCEQIAIISNCFMKDLYSSILGNSQRIKKIIWISTEKNSCAVEGMKEILRIRSENIHD